MGSVRNRLEKESSPGLMLCGAGDARGRVLRNLTAGFPMHASRDSVPKSATDPWLQSAVYVNPLSDVLLANFSTTIIQSVVCPIYCHHYAQLAYI